MSDLSNLESNDTLDHDMREPDTTALKNGALNLDHSHGSEMPEPAETETVPQSNLREESSPFDLIDSIARLITGLILEGGHELLSILQKSEKTTQSESRQPDSRPAEDLNTAEKAGFIMLGMLVESMDQTRKMVDQMARIGTDIGKNVEKVIDPLTDNFLMRPFKNSYLQLKKQADETAQRWLELGQKEEVQARAVARSTTSQIIDRVVNHLESSGSTEALVRTQADTYIQFLIENPTLVNALVEDQADQYLKHVQENPELMQALIQDQSLGMAAELMDEVRERTVTVDTLVERFVRNIFRRQQRSAVTPPEVRRLAERTAGGAHSNDSELHEEST
ncbi:MAG: hypothetical protein AAGD96_03240 [Chloroflexota bacterium]